ncbi:torsin-1A-interacting protein 2-like isoform X1 [Pyxicephalus adspersus]|uniref:torsin-1A-interacting protein 2-like isoform X1 n=1 Tax=Pyxicephalus adspersus TaxID=30357 RepID=UPI003B5B6FBF
MDGKKQQTKNNQRCENTAQIVNSKNDPSKSSINEEIKEKNFSERDQEGQKVEELRGNQESTGDQLRAELRESGVHPELGPTQSSELELKPKPKQVQNSEPSAEPEPDQVLESSVELARKQELELEPEQDSERSVKLVQDQDFKPEPDQDSESSVELDRDQDSEPSVELDHDRDSERGVEPEPDQDSESSVELDRDQVLKPGVELDRDQDSEPSVELDHDQDSERGVKSEPDQDLEPSVEPELDQDLEPSTEKRPDLEKLWTQVGVAVFVVLIAITVAACQFQFGGTPALDSRSVLQIFLDKFKSLQRDFPEQSQDLWLRSGKMLRNHLNKSAAEEPATLILTAAQDAKQTLLCLGSGLAKTYADARNASWLVIHGPSEARYNDSTAKLHIDEKLSSAFGSSSRAAVINHLEILPPGSLLILYKYCDHENAAYKNVALVFTVLLEDSSLEPDTSLPELEEKVRDFLWQQFIHTDGVKSHQEMDSDKLSGVWSRISHLVLPVFPVRRIEAGSCPFDYKRD